MLFRSSHPEVFLGKGLLEICSKFTGEHLCQIAISIKLQSRAVAEQLFEIALRHGCSPVNLLHIFRTPFLKNTSGRLLLVFHILLYTYICTKCTKLFIHVQEYAFFMNTIYFLYILFHRFKGSLRSSSPAVFV